MLHTILLSLLLLRTCSAMEGTTFGSGTWQHHGGQWWSGSDGSDEWSGGNDWRGGWKEKRWCDEEAEDSEWVMAVTTVARAQVEEDKKEKKARKKGCTSGILRSKCQWLRRSTSATTASRQSQRGG